MSKLDKLKRKLWRSVRVRGEHKVICVEYEYDVDLDCPQLWKITDEDGRDVMVTTINAEDLEDIFTMINEVNL